MTTVRRCEPRSHGRNRTVSPLPGRPPSDSVPHRSTSPALRPCEHSASFRRRASSFVRGFRSSAALLPAAVLGERARCVRRAVRRACACCCPVVAVLGFACGSARHGGRLLGGPAVSDVEATPADVRCFEYPFTRQAGARRPGLRRRRGHLAGSGVRCWCWRRGATCRMDSARSYASSSARLGCTVPCQRLLGRASRGSIQGSRSELLGLGGGAWWGACGRLRTRRCRCGGRRGFVVDHCLGRCVSICAGALAGEAVG